MLKVSGLNRKRLIIAFGIVCALAIILGAIATATDVKDLMRRTEKRDGSEEGREEAAATARAAQ